MISGLLAILALVPSAFAADLPDCRKAGPRTAKPGITCKTSSGGSFKLESRSNEGKEIWKDLATGLLWGDALPERQDRDRASEACARSGPKFRVPTRDEFLSAEKRGFREALPNMKDRFYWSSTPAPGSPNVRYLFNGNFGMTYAVMYNNIPYESVRCVAEP